MIAPFIASIYSSKDELVKIELEPLVYNEWSSKDASEDAEWSLIVQRVMDVELEDGSSWFVRVAMIDPKEDPTTSMWKRDKLFAELSILRWLADNAPTVPVPRVRAFDEDNRLLITDLMPGLDAQHAYPRLSTSAKENSITSWASLSVLMFHIPVPQQFAMVGDSSGSYLSIAAGPAFDTDETTDLLSFFASAVESRRTRSLGELDPEECELLSSRLDRLLERLRPLIALAQATPCMSRFALTHRDPRPTNVMLDESTGEVKGIVDWEYYSCMPACMSVTYPSWIRNPIIEAPAYPNPKNIIDSFSLEGRAERNRLCDFYETTVKTLDMEYYKCLIDGARLRDALAWIENSYSDSDGYAMERWGDPIYDLRERLDELAAALEHHKEVIRDLENATREVQGKLNALLDPIIRLPIELSSDIFLRCLPSTASSASHTAPLLLARICHSWREIAHSTPALWAAICIESPSRRGSDKHFDSWLNYAQHLPLSLSIRGTLQGEEVVTGLVKRHAHRLRNLELDLLCGEELRKITVPFANLQSLTISQGEDEAPHGYFSRGESYYSCTVAECLEMMCAAPNLEACTFLDITHQAGYRAAQYVEQTTHRSLKHLRFGEGSVAPDSRISSTYILYYLTLPALESLFITDFFE
ncbi:phosphotransferase enzyme family-domain-containing protein [Mycena polygramma]|nr:phosphotransferase enzyme family-domain-containing protein [Mycena polygramma]